MNYPACAALTAAGFTAFILLSGCPGPAPHAGTGGSGGDRTTSSSDTTSTSSGEVMCKTPVECPKPPECMVATCDPATAQCGVENASMATKCTSNGGTHCDGKGKCVECSKDAECMNPDPNQCAKGMYTPMTCGADGKCAPGTVVDCWSQGKPCTPDGCASCQGDADCAQFEEGGCQTAACDVNSGTCTVTPVKKASDCMGTTSSTCDGQGMCKPGKYVFVTSVPVPNKGAFGGISEATKICHDLAVAANLGENWIPWLSDAQSSPAMSLMGNTAGPYLRIDGAVVASDWSALTTMMLQHPINVDEYGVNHSGFVVWTGTKSDGTLGPATCGDWKSTVGNGAVGSADVTVPAWSNAGIKPCSSPEGHLYCFQK